MQLTKLQVQQTLQSFLSKENGLNQVLEILLNSMMLVERQEFLSESLDNKGNGYRFGSVFGHGCQIELKIPRDRLSAFTPTILALFRSQESYIKEVSFQLYSKGLTTRDISDVMQIIYGKHYSKSSISTMSRSFYEQMEAWRCRDLEKHYLALYIDALSVKLKRGGKYQNESFYIILALREDFTREVIAITNLPSESSTGWKQVLEGLKERGLESVGLFISDNLPGMDTVIAKEFGASAHQKCIVHLTRNLLAQVRHQDKKELASDLKEVFRPDKMEHTKEMAYQQLMKLSQKWKTKYKALSKYIEKLEWQPYFVYLDYSIHIRRMIYTTNWIERFNKSCRRTLKIRGAFPDEDSVLALITSTAIEKTAKHYAYPIYNFKFEPKLNKKTAH